LFVVGLVEDDLLLPLPLPLLPLLMLLLDDFFLLLVF
jgi:hypothetical protein